MNSTINNQGKFSTAAGRWAGVGPYYAMFPSSFADEVVRNYSSSGDTVLDPFAGRGTAVFSAASQGRHGIGIDINPLGYVYAKAKVETASPVQVVKKLEYILEASRSSDINIYELPQFFHMCYSNNVCKFLLASRNNLLWKRSKIDRTLMALILVYLHGKLGQTLSNQMRHTTAMSPVYSIKWWKERNLEPPEIDVYDFMIKRINWRFLKGAPNIALSNCFLADSKIKLKSLGKDVRSGKLNKSSLLITSPPYQNVTNYYEDQWLRLWLLGYPDKPDPIQSNLLGCKFRSSRSHFELLDGVFSASRDLLSEDATIYVRTDKREVTYNNTLLALEKNFPEKKFDKEEKPLPPDKQLKAYCRGGAPKNHNCEVDIILTPR